MSLFRSAVLIGVLVFLAGIVNAQVCVDLTGNPSPKHWWTADGSTKDISGTNNGVLVNGATYGPGMVNSAFKLNGFNYVDIGNLNPLGLGTFAVEAWVKVDANNFGDRRVVGWDNFGFGTRSAFALKSSTGGASGKPSFVVVNGGAVDSIVAPTALSNGWHHLAAIRDVSGTGTMTLIVDGNVVATKTNLNTLLPVLSSENAVIGTVNSSNQVESFVGCIDEVSIYDTTVPGAAFFKSVFLAGAAGKCHENADLLTTITASNQMPDNNTPVTYTVTVKNKGPNTANNVVLTTTFDPNLTNIACPTCPVGTFSLAGNVATINVGTLTSGASSVYSIDSKVSPCAVDNTPITVTAMAMASTPDPVGQNNAATAIVYNCDTTLPSVDAVSLSSIAQDYVVTVATTCTGFFAISDSPWLTATVVGNQVTIHVTANTGSTSRQGYLFISPTPGPILNNFVYPSIMVTQSPGGGLYSVAGRVWNKYQTAGVPSVTLTISTYSGFCPAMAPFTVTTDLFGNWNATGFQPGCNYLVTPPAGYRLARQVFNRASTTINFYSTAP